MGLLNAEEQEFIFKPYIKQAQFSFAPIYRCNLHCKYCFADCGENFKGDKRKMAPEMIDKILNFVYFDYYNACGEYRIDFVSGGEPLLNFEIIQYAIEKSKNILYGTGKKLCVFLATNGTIYDSEILKYIDRNNINMGISIDGEKSVHDKNRCYESGAGSYDKVKRLIYQIRNSKQLSSHTKDIWGVTVITGESQHISEIIKHHRSIGINHMQMELVRASKDIEYLINDTNVNRLIQEYKMLTDFFLAEINQGSFENLKLILNDNDYYGKIACRIIDGGRVYYRCSAGIGKINFDARGNIYPCEFFVGNPDYCIGNVEEGIDKNKQRQFYDENVNVRKECKKCWARYLCGGDCYYNSLLVNGDIFTPDKQENHRICIGNHDNIKAKGTFKRVCQLYSDEKNPVKRCRRKYK